MLWIIAIAVILALVLYILWKKVVIPSISVVTDKGEYVPNETVQISGSLTAPDSAGQTVQLVVTPPVGDSIALPDVVTDSSGDYTSQWVVPASPDAGIYTISVTAVGAIGSTTFTHEILEHYGIDTNQMEVVV